MSKYDAEYQRAWRAAHPNYNAEWRAQNRSKSRAAWRAWRARNPVPAGSVRATWERWVTTNPDRWAMVKRANTRVGIALRQGRLVRPSLCEECGAEARVEAAHGDYSRPLDVRWLCHSCHDSWDQLQPKTLIHQQ